MLLIDGSGDQVIFLETIGLEALLHRTCSDGPTTYGTTIAYNGLNGVSVEQAADTFNEVIRNSIFANGFLGINVGTPGVKLNQTTTFPNYPVLTLIGTDRLTIEASLNSEPNSTVDIELYSNSNCNVWGLGEGETLIWTLQVTTDSSGNITFSTQAFEPMVVGHFITATTTDAMHGTSEFSECVVVPAITANLPTVTVISPSSGVQGSSITATISGTGLSGATAVTFSGAGVTATIGDGGTATTLPVTVAIDRDAGFGITDGDGHEGGRTLGAVHRLCGDRSHANRSCVGEVVGHCISDLVAIESGTRREHHRCW